MMRSLLFVPADSQRKLAKSLSSGADALILDLEDSVPPDAKPQARELAAQFLAADRGIASPKLYVRVNDLRSGLSDDDLAAVMPARPDGIILPKSESAADVERLSVRLRVHEAIHGLANGSTAILPIITETAASLLAAGTYASGHARLSGLTWGAEDLSAAIGARASRDDSGRYTDLFRHARTMTLLAASASDVAAIDTVFLDFRDPDGLRLECLEAERDGFTGKLAIHPGQVEIINAAFTPASEAVEEASRLVEAFRAAGNPGVLGLDGRMYDIPHLKRAQRLLARAAAAARD